MVQGSYWPAGADRVMLYGYGMNVAPEVIYVIRHAEKPLKPPLSGVDYEGGGYSAFYGQLYPLVRRVNQRLPEGRKLRVLALDPPIDWSKVKSPAAFNAFLSERDQSIASVMETEVFSRHRKALMVIGSGHILHGRGAAAQIYEQRYPGKTFTIVNHEGFAKDNDNLERRMASWPVPSLTTFKGTWLGEVDSSYFNLPGNPPMPPGNGYRGRTATCIWVRGTCCCTSPYPPALSWTGIS